MPNTKRFSFRSGFLARLSHLIIVQIAFVCVALIIILFDTSDNGVETEFRDSSSIQDRLSSRIQTLLYSETLLDSEPKLPPPTAEGIDQLLKQDSAVLSIEIFRVARERDPGDSVTLLYWYGREENGDQYPSRRALRPAGDKRAMSDPETHPGFAFSLDGSTLSTIMRFPIGESLDVAVLVTREHGMLISKRNSLQYTLLLIALVSILIGLLIVYLISIRFRQPLGDLIDGFKRTARGEIYLMVEPSGDKEIYELSSTFNAMSRSLQATHNRLSASNRRLEKSNRQLRNSRSFLETIIEHTPSGIISTDSDGFINIFNVQAEEYFGYSQAEVADKSIDDYFTRSVDSLEPGAASEDGSLQGELLARKKDGSLFPVLVIQSELTNETGGNVGWVYMIRDISESKSFQEMILRVDRYYTRGQMAADIAHEINNHLAVMSGSLELIPMFLAREEKEKIEYNVGVMRESLDKIMRFSDGLADPQQGERVIARGDINQAVENILAFLRPQNRFDGITFEVELSTEIPLVEFDMAQLEQVLTNLLYNAGEALSSSGSDRWIRVSTARDSISDGGAVRIEISDSGPGIPEENRAKLFTQRFSTKRKGNGLGLLSSREIIESHGGRIEYSDRPHSTFAFILPVCQPHADNWSAARHRQNQLVSV